ncbi:hypothetical protein RHSIM_Rhsim02G0174900 [Rhododendron simsii]|uniref:Uncharacterized protein n=1 Tax=Rhododendron simsii TaxID=118357 RepID=A0A834LWV9_RHOSS|nr:hypothetical protein RHSIM_Rhsim02G0174900 [Rhododendron simsii]
MRAERKRDAEEVEKKKWVNGLKGRNFTCERQVDRTKMGTHPIIKVINRQVDLGRNDEIPSPTTSLTGKSFMFLALMMMLTGLGGFGARSSNPEKLTPGPITGGLVEKTKSLSQPTHPDIVGASLPATTTQAARHKQGMRIMSCQLNSIQGKQKKLETQIRWTRRDVSAIKRALLWFVARCGSETGESYIPAEEDLREFTPEEQTEDEVPGTNEVVKEQAQEGVEKNRR